MVFALGKRMVPAVEAVRPEVVLPMIHPVLSVAPRVRVFGSAFVSESS
jgi:hypothetical protein